MTAEDFEEDRDIGLEVDEYRVKFFRYLPGVGARYADDLDMPWDLWEQCRLEVDAIEGRE